MVRLWDPRLPKGGQANASSAHDPWPGTSGGGGGKSSSSSSSLSLQGGKWVAALAADPGGNFVVAGGGVEGRGLSGPQGEGFVSVLHLPSMARVSSATTPSFVQDVRFLEDKVWVWGRRGRKGKEVERVSWRANPKLTASLLTHHP